MRTHLFAAWGVGDTATPCRPGGDPTRAVGLVKGRRMDQGYERARNERWPVRRPPPWRRARVDRCPSRRSRYSRRRRGGAGEGAGAEGTAGERVRQEVDTRSTETRTHTFGTRRPRCVAPPSNFGRKEAEFPAKAMDFVAERTERGELPHRRRRGSGAPRCRSIRAPPAVAGGGGSGAAVGFFGAIREGVEQRPLQRHQLGRNGVAAVLAGAGLSRESDPPSGRAQPHRPGCRSPATTQC